MFNSKFILILLSFFFICIFSCKKIDKKYEVLPELDLGNNMNPKSGTEYVKLDSTRVITTSFAKYLKSYISINATAISDMGFTWSKIYVYKNGYYSVFFNSGSTNKSFLDNVVTGQVLKFEFTVVDINGRESKKSKLFVVTVP